MAGDSATGRWRRVLEAREQARAELGADFQSAPFDGPTPKRSARYVKPVERRPDESIGVLTLGETAAKLGVSRRELEAMINAGTIEVLPTGFTRMIPSREVERLSRN